MKIKIDENLPLALVGRLRQMGHDAHSVFEENLGGHPDSDLWQACLAEDRFLISQDLDFSDIRKYPPGSHPGILLVRLSNDSRENLLTTVHGLFKRHDVAKWQKCLVVLTDVKLRVKTPDSGLPP